MQNCAVPAVYLTPVIRRGSASIGHVNFIEKIGAEEKAFAKAPLDGEHSSPPY